MPKKRRIFTPEYKEEAAKLVVESSRPIAESARGIGVNEQTLRHWSMAIGWREGRVLHQDHREPGPGWLVARTTALSP
jgi:transposase